MIKTLHDWIETDVRPYQEQSVAWLSQYHFFRDPIRPTYSDPRCFFSPADGVILYQRQVRPEEAIVDIKGKAYSLRDALRDPEFKAESLIIGIFMTFFDVHVNRIPYPGLLSFKELDPIDTYNHPMLDVEKQLVQDLRISTDLLDYLHHNQRVVNRIFSSRLGHSYYVLQVADYDADCITPFNLKQNQPAAQGQRFSMIRYGSQVDLIVPLSSRFDFETLQNTGDHVEAGIDPLIKIDSKDKTTTPIPFMKALRRGLNCNGHTHHRNGHSRRGNGRTRPGRITVAETAATQKRSSVGHSVRLTEGAPETFTIRIGQEPRQPELKTVSPWLNPTQFDRPAFLMNFPFSYSTACANNPWMQDLKDDKRRPDFTRAAVQFLALYQSISAEGLVYLLPTPRGSGLQDLHYTANLGIVLDHLPDKNTVVISNFTSEPRRGETRVGVNFFQDMGYAVHVAPTKFEGEAELKHLHDNVYVGGYGIRSEKETYDWMEQCFDMRIIKVRETEPYLCHLDCSIFPITKENTLVCTDLFSKMEIAELERVTNIIPVNSDEAFSGICNSVRLANQVINSSHIHELKAGTEDYQHEIQKNRKLEDIAANLALEVSYFNLSEFHKSGALLSCMVMHLNRSCYKITPTA